MTLVTDSPPRAPPVKYTAPLGTRWDKEKAAAGGASAFDLPTDPKNIGPWILGECVGKGASGRVKIAKHKRTGQLAAVKILPVAPLVNSRASLATQKAKSDKLRLGIDREITMMKLMNHPNIMRIYDVFEGDKELFLVLEYVEGGELFDFLVNRGRLPPNEALEYFRQIVYGLNYAHTFSIIHRDLKPENILIASLTPPLIKIADWGMAAFAPPSLQLETSCGSPHYASPEIVNGEKYQGNATDIWSCGVILFALLTGRLPFDDKNVRTLLSKVKSGKFDMPTWIDPLAKNLLERMLVVDVKKRITIPEILSHPWLLTQSSASSMSAPSTSNFLVPLMPPSPSTLARPIASPHLIDPELLLSLRIIWGRHTDAQGTSIIRDLCAPAGHGVHAKAFYFLLNMYREETSRNRMAEAIDEGGHKQSDTALGTVKFKLGRKTDQTGPADRSNGGRNSVNAAISPAPPSPRHPGLSGSTPSLMHRGKTVEGGTSPRIKFGSPIGPRPPPLSLHDADRAQPNVWRTQVRKRETAPLARPKVSMGPRPAPTSRGNTYSSFAERQTIEALPTGTPVSLQSSGAPIQRQKMKASSADPPTLSMDVDTDQVLYSSTRSPSSRGAMAGSMFSTTQTPMSAPITTPIANVTMGLNLPLLTAPQTDDPQLQKTMDEFTERVNIIVQAAVRSATLTNAGVSTPSTNADEVQMSTENVNPLPLSQGITTEPREAVDTRVEAQGSNTRSDKENRTSGEEGWSYVDVSNEQSGLGLGVGVSREMGKELINIGNAGPDSSPAKNKKGKEKKTRPPPIELPSLHPKRSTMSMLGSPIALASAVHNPIAASSNRLLASPVVGEFKGWFSNLFNWKLHQSTGQVGVVYSVYDLNRTREDVVKLLETLGFSIMRYPMEYPADIDLLSCRLDRQITDPASNTTLKPLRLRVEISTGCGFSSQPSPVPTGDENPYFKPSIPPTHQNYLTTPTSATIPRPRSALMGGGKGSAAYPTPLPSPIGFPKWELPRGCACAIALVHEKGSMSTFRVVWRKLKDMYGDSPAPYPCFSPAMATTPFVEHQQRFAV